MHQIISFSLLFFSLQMEDNPWNIKSIYDLQYFNCPSCLYKHQFKQEIVDHAFEFHPESIEILSKIKDQSLIDIICPWDNKCIIKEEFCSGINIFH